MNLIPKFLHPSTRRYSSNPRSYVDVHTHIFHKAFNGKYNEIVNRAMDAGLKHVIVNGLEPSSNRIVLDLCSQYPDILLPAIGIYPIEACANELSKNPSLFKGNFAPPGVFNVNEEIDFIEQQAEAKNIVAIGECGLDGYYVEKNQSAFIQQEEVFGKLIEVALKHELPLIIHARKAEKRTFEMLKFYNVKKADFHCFGGSVSLAKQIVAEGYYISIPPAINRLSHFKSFAKNLPLNQILTETDAPYMGPSKTSGNNEPCNIPIAVKCIAEERGESIEVVVEEILKNFNDLFGDSVSSFSLK